MSALLGMTSSNQSQTEFTIEYILNRAGCPEKEDIDNKTIKNIIRNINFGRKPYSWVQTSRYFPPKIQRKNKKGTPQKRQLGRNPRIPFSPVQLRTLEQIFQTKKYLSSEEVILLSRQLYLPDIRVKIWFQNRRARQKREEKTENKGPQPIKVDSYCIQEKCDLELNS